MDILNEMPMEPSKSIEMKMSAGEFDNFKRICNKLFSTCFICKKNETTKSDYYFILRHKEIFDSYIRILGFRLDINDEYGVIQMVNTQNANRLNLKLFESIILIILRILYDEKKRELSLANDVIIEIGEVQDRFMALKIRDRIIDKTTMGNTLKLFKRYNLIEPLDKDLGREDSRIVLYDSILMAVRVDDIKDAYKKIELYRKGEVCDEETDETEAD